jgi:hypothetical protein
MRRGRRIWLPHRQPAQLLRCSASSHLIQLLAAKVTIGSWRCALGRVHRSINSAAVPPTSGPAHSVIHTVANRRPAALASFDARPAAFRIATPRGFPVMRFGISAGL